MKFVAKSEDQLIKESLLPEGEYDFEVGGAEDAVSQKGNEMIKLTLKVYRPSGNGFAYVTDYLMEKMAFKLVHFAKATGLLSSYEQGSLTAQECVGRAGRVKLKVEEQDGYQPKNAVKDYVVAERKESPHAPVVAAPAQAAPADDGIPF